MQISVVAAARQCASRQHLRLTGQAWQKAGCAGLRWLQPLPGTNSSVIASTSFTPCGAHRGVALLQQPCAFGAAEELAQSAPRRGGEHGDVVLVEDGDRGTEERDGAVWAVVGLREAGFEQRGPADRVG